MPRLTAATAAFMAIGLAAEAESSAWLRLSGLRQVAPETHPPEEAVDLLEVRARVGCIRGILRRVVPLLEPLQVARIGPRDLAERPAGEDAEVQDAARWAARRRTGCA